MRAYYPHFCLRAWDPLPGPGGVPAPDPHRRLLSAIRPRALSANQRVVMVRELLRRHQGDCSSIDPLLFFEVGEEIGKGAFGSVKLATHILCGAKVAIKTYDKYKVLVALLLPPLQLSAPPPLASGWGGGNAPACVVMHLVSCCTRPPLVYAALGFNLPVGSG